MVMALEKVMGRAPDLVWHKETDLGSPDLIVLPGGFSYGDYLRCGAMAAHSPIMKEVIRHAERGTRILGVCNGFQVLVETRILPGGLLRNRDLKFICKHVHLRAENTDNPFMSQMKQGDVMHVPVAHGDGNYFTDDDSLKMMEDQGLIAFRYVNAKGEDDEAANANGSIRNIAGILNRRKTILGKMPHPENATDDWQDNKSALPFFKGMVEAVAA